MEPTNAEMIFWIVCAVICLIVLVRSMCEPSDTFEITDRHLRDWERREKEWYK